MPTTEELLQQAESLNEAEKFQEVIDLLPDALLEERQSAELYTERAIAYEGLQEHEKQRANCEKAIVLNAGYYKVYFSRGNYWQAKSEYDKAITDFNQALELKPDDAVAYNNRGLAWYSKGDYNKAIADYDRVIGLKPDNAVAYSNRGSAWYTKGEYDKAIADYDRAIELKPNFETAYNNRAGAWYTKGDYDKAISDYDRAIELKPNDTVIYNNRAGAWYTKGEYDKAILDYGHVIELNPEYADAYHKRGSAYYNRGDYDKAISDYDRAIELKPNDTVIYNNRGSAWNKKGDYDKAIADYGRAIELEPDNADAYYNRGNAWHNKGEYDLAIADYDRAIELKPDNAAAYYNRGNAWNKKSDYDKAIADYDWVIELNPNDADTYHNRGSAWYSKVDYDKAIADYNQAIKLNKFLANPFFGLGMVFYKRESYQLASIHFIRAYFLQLPLRGLIKPFSEYQFNPFILNEIFQKSVNLKTFIRYQIEIEFCVNTCKKWLLVLDYLEIVQLDLLSGTGYLRLQTIVNYYMGHTPNAYKLIDEQLDYLGLNLRDQYYFIQAANGFLEPFEGILIFAKKQIEEMPDKNPEDWYYSGRIHLLSQEFEKAEYNFLQAPNFLPNLYALFGLYRQQQRFEKELEVAEKIKTLKEKGNGPYFLNGIMPIVIKAKTVADLETSFYERLYYYELLEEINAVRVALELNAPFKHLEFWDLPDLEEEFLKKIEEEITRKDNRVLFAEMVAAYVEKHDENMEKAVYAQINKKAVIGDLNRNVKAAVDESKEPTTYEEQIAVRIEDMQQPPVLYFVVIKYFYFCKFITPEQAFVLHFFVVKKARQLKDVQVVADFEDELKTWLPLLSDALQSPAGMKLLTNIFKRVMNGKPVFQMNDYKNYEEFKEKFIDQYMVAWQDNVIRAEIEKNNFTRKTDMDKE